MRIGKSECVSITIAFCAALAPLTRVDRSDEYVMSFVMTCDVLLPFYALAVSNTFIGSLMPGRISNRAYLSKIIRRVAAWPVAVVSR